MKILCRISGASREGDAAERIVRWVYGTRYKSLSILQLFAMITLPATAGIAIG